MYYIKGKRIEILDSKKFGFSTRTAVGQIEDMKVLIKDRKSRIIMKDGRQILEQIESIKKQTKDKRVALLTNAPICSKTTNFFKESRIEVYQLEK